LGLSARLDQPIQPTDFAKLNSEAQSGIRRCGLDKPVAFDCGVMIFMRIGCWLVPKRKYQLDKPVAFAALVWVLPLTYQRANRSLIEG
jgi:hypothetical protein